MSVSTTSLTFTSSTWNTAQTVTVTAAHDDDATDDTATLTHTASGGGYDAVTASLAVQVNDNDKRGIVFEPSEPRMQLREGSEASYGVSLLSEPSGVVRVSVSSAHSGVSVSPTTLTFTPNTWWEPQSVTLGIARGAHAISPTVLIRHLASGADYDGVSAERSMTLAQSLSALSVSLGAAETGNEGADMVLPILLSSSLEQDEQVRVRFVVGADGDTATTADYRVVSNDLVFAGGQSGGAIRINVLDDALSEPEETLTVSLLEVSSSDVRREISLIDAERMYRIAASDALTISLSASVDRIQEGGDSAVFQVSLSGGELDSALSVGVFVHPGSTADARDVVGLPAFVTLVSGARAFDFAVSALQETGIQDEGDERLTLTLGLPTSELNLSLADATASVMIGEIDSLARKSGVQLGLGAYARSVGSGLVETIGARSRALKDIDGELSSVQVGGASLTQTLALGRGDESTSNSGVSELARALQRLLAPASNAGGGPRSSSQSLLSGSEFLLTSDQAADSESNFGRWAAWGQGSLSHHKMEQHQIRIDGDLRSIRLGFDVRLREDLLAGLALSRDVGDADYLLSDGQSGSLRAETTGIYPYMHWRPMPGIGTWGAFGYGVGDARLDDGLGNPVQTNIELGLLAAGVHQDMFAVGNTSWALHSDAFLVEVDADEVEGGALLPSTSARAWRLRTALEVQTGAFSSPLSGSFDLGFRLDGGDARYGGSVEVGASLAYVNPDAGIEARLRGRWMSSLHPSQAQEHGIGLSFTYDAGMIGRGWMLTALPEWGQPLTGAKSLWEGADPLSGVDTGGLWADAASLRLPVRVGYGVGLGDERLLTPFAEWTSIGDLVEQRVGAELALPLIRGFELEVGLYRQQVSGDRLGGAHHTKSLNNGFGGTRLDAGWSGSGAYRYAAPGHTPSTLGAGLGGWGTSGYAGPDGVSMALEALLSRSLNDGLGELLFGAKALNAEASIQIEALMQINMRF